MSKLVAHNVTRNGKIISFEVPYMSEYHLNLFMHELEPLDMLDVTVKAHKENRSTRQNSMLWALITKISDNVNASHREEDTFKVYCDLLVKANVEYVFLAVEAKARPLLEKQFRVVQEIPSQVQTTKGRTLQGYKCFIGSSKFNSKEMTELIELALDMAHEVGVVDSEILAIESEYKL